MEYKINCHQLTSELKNKQVKYDDRSDLRNVYNSYYVLNKERIIISGAMMLVYTILIVVVVVLMATNQMMYTKVLQPMAIMSSVGSTYTITSSSHY